MTDGKRCAVIDDPHVRCLTILPIFAFALLPFGAGCNGTEMGTPDMGQQQSGCGLAGSAEGTECTGLSSCGAGAPNEVQPSFCDNCLLRPDSHICESGQCIENDGRGTLRLGLEGNSAIPSAKSVAIASLSPLMADGTTITCEALLSTCGFLNNNKINTTNSTSQTYNPDPAMITFTAISARVGEGRLLFVQATDDIRGSGAVVARTCLDNITVVEGETQTLGISLVPVP